MKRIPEETRIQQINALPNIEFVRWDGEYRNGKTKAVCRCLVDGYEWSATVASLSNAGRGCPQCGGSRRWTEGERIAQINARPNIEFVRWEGCYKNSYSKAVLRCSIDGFEWATSVNSLINGGTGCPKCKSVRLASVFMAPEDSVISKINARPNIEFVRWEGCYKNSNSKAVLRCSIDGFEWSSRVYSLINAGTGCPRCGGVSVSEKLRMPEHKVIYKINKLPKVSFVRWENGYTNAKSKAVCRCTVVGHEWQISVSDALRGRGCPYCAEYGYNPAKAASLYALRSECGQMVKIGISNNYEQRLAILKRKTPFNWHCIELVHSNDGAFIAELEKELHSFTEPAIFSQPFDGYTEWRKWDDRLPRWVERYRARLARIVAP